MAYVYELDEKISQAKKLLADPEMAAMAQEEISRLEEEKNYILGVPKKEEAAPGEDKYDRRNIILEIRGAAGGEEAKMWGEDLLRMYSRFAEVRGWKQELIDWPASGLVSGTGRTAVNQNKRQRRLREIEI